MTVFGRPHLHLRHTESTNDRARELAEAGAPSGTIVTADEQSAGRGRRGRVWSAPAGRALLFSAVLRPLELEHGLLPLAVPVAVCEAIETMAPVRVRVKWPNDIWLDESKVAGVLIEARFPDWAVIGIGVNVAIEPEEFPADLRWPATSIGRGSGCRRCAMRCARRSASWTSRPGGRDSGRVSSPRRAHRPEADLGGRGPRRPARARAPGSTSAGTCWSSSTTAGRAALGSGEVSLRLAFE